MSSACPQELEKQSSYSPSTVNSDEPIVFVLLDPDHWQNERLAKGAFSMRKLKASGVSICRANYTNATTAFSNIVKPQLNRSPDRRLIGALRTICRDVRTIRASVDSVQVVCVVDDGTLKDPAHALLKLSEATKDLGFWDRNKKETVRAELARIFGNKRDFTDCFA